MIDSFLTLALRTNSIAMLCFLAICSALARIVSLNGSANFG